MKFSCDSCNAQYMIADEKVGGRGVKVKCKKCGNVIVVKPLAAQSDDAPTAGDVAAPSPQTSAESPQAQQEQPGQSQIGGAFDSLFGSSTGDAGASGGAGFGFGDGAAQAPAPSSTPAGEKEWYVAIDDAQVGPIDLRDIEQRWDAREINEDSLSWKAGMPDWVPLAEIPDLAYLITERPQASASSQLTASQTFAAGQAAAGGDAAAAGSPAAAGAARSGRLGPVSLGGGEEAPQVDWKPSAASALSSLVEEELAGSETQAPEPTEKPPTGVPELGMPGFGAGDLFGGGGNGGTDAAGGGFGMPGPSGGGVSANWGVPQSRSTGGLKTSHVVIGSVGAMAVVTTIAAVVAFALWPSMKAGGTQPGAAQPATARPGAAQPAAAQPAAAQPAAAQPAAAAAPAPTSAPAPKTKRERRKERRKERQTTAPKPPPTPRADPEPRAAPAKKSLGRDDIVNGVKKNAKTVAPCLAAARRKNEISPGKYTFVLDWTIRPNGSVGGARLKGPGNVLSSSLPRCFATAMGRWRFPASRDGMPISNFPFGPINVR